MGHVRLGVLPKSRKWQQVIEQLRLGADVAAVAGLAADAAEASLQGASNDPAFLHAFWLLTQSRSRHVARRSRKICGALGLRCRTSRA